jgi:hypothetical protein
VGTRWKDPRVPTVTPSNTGNQTRLHNRFLEAIHDSFLFQHVDKPTHARGTQAENTLDLILTNEENMVNKVCHEAPLGKSHHSCLIFELICRTSQNVTYRTGSSLNRGDYEALRQKLQPLSNQNFVNLPVAESNRIERQQ